MLNISTFPKIDAHIHLSFYDERYVDIAQRYNIRMINVNTDAGLFPSLLEQERVALEYVHKHPCIFAYISTFNAEKYLFTNKAEQIDFIRLSIKKGAIGVKIWKNVGMEIKDNHGEFVMASDEVFDDFYHYLEKHNIPLLAHLGEPKNCWLPHEEMSSVWNRLYYTRFPEFHMFLHPDYPSYDDHIGARDTVLQNFKNLNFIGAHFGSMEWSIDHVSARLDLYPNFSIDIASRINHLQFQSMENYTEVRDFMIKYADRIMYGTDVIDDIDRLENTYNNNWLYLATDTRECLVETNKSCRGLNLPKEVLEKIYFTTAMNKYSLLQNQFNLNKKL